MYIPASWKSYWLPFGLLGVVVTITFGGALGNGFVNYDDPVLILNNPLVHTLSPRIWWSFDPQLYDPLTLLLYQLLHLAFGFSPAAYHGASLLLHIGNTMLLFVFLRRFLRDDRMALCGALLFGVHPMQTEAVAWASGMKDLLCAFFFLSAIVSYEHPQENLRRLTPLFFFLALLAKVTAITLPFVLLLLDASRQGSIEGRHVKDKTLYFAIAAAFGLIAMLGRGAAAAALSPWEVILLGARSIFFYLQKFILPIGLSAVYPAPALWIGNPAIAASVVGAVSLICLCIWLRRARPTVVFGIAFFLLTLSPSLLAYQKGGEVILAADRYAYLSSIGLVVAIVSLLAGLNNRKVVLGALLAVALIGVPLSWKQTRTWASTDAVFFNVAKNYPTSSVALTYIGYAAMQRGNLGRAETLLRAAIRSNETNPRAWLNLSGTLVLSRRYAEAENAAREAVRRDPYNPDAYLNLAWAYLGQGETDKASSAYHVALKLAPCLAGTIPVLE